MTFTATKARLLKSAMNVKTARKIEGVIINPLLIKRGCWPRRGMPGWGVESDQTRAIDYFDRHLHEVK
jgi:hypothetical protein